jgi:uncharacterized protein YodC (DUF2158 family)
VNKGDVKAGDVVTLNSGGPNMTVLSSTGDSAMCIWFALDGTVASHAFPFAIIKASK